MGGFELIEKMRADPRFAKIPVVISSHRGISEDKDRAEKLGVSDFIVQGFTTPREVVRRIELMLGVSRKFRIAVSLDRFSAPALIEILNRNQALPCVSAPGEEIVLELEGTPELFRQSLKRENADGTGRYVIQVKPHHYVSIMENATRSET